MWPVVNIYFQKWPLKKKVWPPLSAIYIVLSCSPEVDSVQEKFGNILLGVVYDLLSFPKRKKNT